jgi:carboxyl-terminal processing protease
VVKACTGLFVRLHFYLHVVLKNLFVQAAESLLVVLAVHLLYIGVFFMRLSHSIIACFTVSLFVFTSLNPGQVMSADFDAGRNRLIASMLSHQLPIQHFERKVFDKEMSKIAYDLYLRQLDPRKQFLLASDVEQLNTFAETIHTEIRRGRIILPDKGMELLNRRINEAEQLVLGILENGIDPHSDDTLETDHKKIEYAATREDLKDRWRRSLKLEVLESYLDEIEKENKQREKEEKTLLKPDPLEQDIWAKAVEKVRRKTNNYLSRLHKMSRQEHYNRYFDAVARSFDPHTTYMPPSSKEDFDIHMSGSLEGIGALLREDDGQIKVVRIIPGSAAEAQGQLAAEDTIMAVSEKDGEPVDISAMSIREAVSHIRGPKGTEVRLTVVKPDGTRLVIPIIRDVVRLEETYVKSTVLKGKKEHTIAYVKIPSFYRDFSSNPFQEDSRNVTDDTRAALHSLKEEGIQGLILDLRNNGGGSLSDAVDVSGLFLPSGPVVQVKDQSGKIQVLEDYDKNMAYTGPIIVLVNQFSASASEILAGALQDYGRALIVGGQHTHGKGTVQSLMDMNRNLPLLHFKKYDLGALKVTIQKFYRINGSSTQYKGIHPDVQVPSMLDFLETGEQYMDNSLPWDQVDPVAHTPWKGPRLNVEAAQAKVQEYLATSEKFKKIKEGRLRAKERRERNLIQVSLAAVIKERKTLEQERKESEAIGFFEEEAEDDYGKEKKNLADELADDPYIDLALFLMDSSLASMQENSWAK